MNHALQSARNYTDFDGFAALRAGARDATPAAAEAAARQFEALFIQMMLKSMREASMGDALLDSDQTRLYRDLFDKQVAIDLAAKGDLKLADQIMQQLGAQPSEPDLLPGEGAFPEAADAALRMPAVPTRAQRELAAALLEHAETVTPHDVPTRARTDADPYNDVAGADAVHAAAAADAARIETPEDFVRMLKPHAEAAARALGVQPDVLLAQAALETGWGSRMIRRADGSSSFNLFGIKAGSGWSGERVRVSTLEYADGVARREMASFRAYGSYAESFQDYVSFLSSHPRYAQALDRSGDPSAFMRSLQQAGYATDPQYARKVVEVMQRSAIAAPAASIHTVANP